MSTKRRARGVHSSPQPKDADGNRLCRNCGTILPKGKRFNCSSKCSEEWQGKTSPSYMKRLVFNRDRGICARCQADTVALKAGYEALPRDPRNVRNAYLDKYGIPHSRSWGDWWDADHIVPVIEGGGECGLSNFRTLCIPCHKIITKELHGRLKRQRIEAKPLPLFDTVNQ
jgi:5-methylcytosine-specific restriction enzyme A